MTKETKVKLKMMALAFVMAGIFVYIIKIPYLSFLMGGMTVAINNIMWKEATKSGR